MKNIDVILQEHNLDRSQIEELLRQNRKIEAIKVVRDATNYTLKSSKNLVESIEGNQTHFIEDDAFKNSKVSVKMLNKNGKVIIRLKLNNQPEKIVFPSDPDWAEVKKAMGNNPQLLAYEKAYLENPNDFQYQKNTLFIEEDNSGKWKFVLLASVITIVIIYFIYSKS
ncbi:hypothetical protein [Epilithonimonas arachidiradicis]|uniref:Ribosomal L7/L12-like protein n=1 Tax=Epilithonimonas arachidiradicis TaxID=1617282 RepID=A0A420D8F3_9FLAO|nr:hypothetical protein [Epilithonimonas arachidiradicis]RKE86951.1 ribosomal L7/L12-like protein [Epilithonimonas arachidiradicis]GGG60853.1 hypothetical protein GCM10007332_23340 [Epilithonimonas arachidiradicis]